MAAKAHRIQVERPPPRTSYFGEPLPCTAWMPMWVGWCDRGCAIGRRRSDGEAAVVDASGGAAGIRRASVAVRVARRVEYRGGPTGGATGSGGAVGTGNAGGGSVGSTPPQPRDPRARRSGPTPSDAGCSCDLVADGQPVGSVGTVALLAPCLEAPAQKRQAAERNVYLSSSAGKAIGGALGSVHLETKDVGALCVGNIEGAARRGHGGALHLQSAVEAGDRPCCAPHPRKCCRTLQRPTFSAPGARSRAPRLPLPATKKVALRSAACLFAQAPSETRLPTKSHVPHAYDGGPSRARSHEQPASLGVGP